MAMTMSQKILAAHTGLKSVKKGQLIQAKIDLVLGNDITSPLAIKEFSKIGVDRIFNRKKVVIVQDHFTPNKDIDAAEQCKMIRKFVRKMGINNFFDVGEMGIEHVLIPEKGLVVPGYVVVGADSHTCTYGALGAFSTGVGSTDMAAAMATGRCWFKVPGALQFILSGKPPKYVSGKDVILHIIGMIGVEGAQYKSMEFGGDGLRFLSMDSRFTIANMAIEAGGKNGIFPVDEKTMEYVKSHSSKSHRIYQPDEDAEYDDTYEIDISSIPPTVAFPHSPGNTRPISDVGYIKIDQVVIGSCTNGRMEDLRIAARLMKGKKVARDVRVIIIPGTQYIYLQALKEGLIKTFIQAGAAVSTPTCGPCLGGHMGVLAKGERAISTTNRNFVGRMGHPESEVYLASPVVAAASAITGRISNPEEIENDV
jgi:3-isopropylmalate/(R)-2-methylmalate dehydratase large subunit